MKEVGTSGGSKGGGIKFVFHRSWRAKKIKKSLKFAPNPYLFK